MPTTEALARYADGFNKSLSLRWYGITLEFPSADRVRATLPVRPEHRGGLGTEAVNGAILASLFDLVIGCTGALVDPARRSATMQLSMSFVAPAQGDVMIAEGWLDRAGKATLFASAEIRNERGETCARCTGVVKHASIPWAREGTPAVN